MIFKIRFKGGPGSGHHGHQGIPGKQGGSLPGSGGGGSVDARTAGALNFKYKLDTLNLTHTDYNELIQTRGSTKFKGKIMAALQELANPGLRDSTDWDALARLEDEWNSSDMSIDALLNKASNLGK